MFLMQDFGLEFQEFQFIALDKTFALPLKYFQPLKIPQFHNIFRLILSKYSESSRTSFTHSTPKVMS